MSILACSESEKVRGVVRMVTLDIVVVAVAITSALIAAVIKTFLLYI
jgi:hypothetical protein